VLPPPRSLDGSDAARSTGKFRRTSSRFDAEPTSMDDHRLEREEEFIKEIIRIVGPGADPDDYVVAPSTTDELLESIQRLRELPDWP
jgi:hypothetical protein